MECSQKKFREIELFDFTSCFAWTFLNFLARCVLVYVNVVLAIILVVNYRALQMKLKSLIAGNCFALTKMSFRQSQIETKVHITFFTLVIIRDINAEEIKDQQAFQSNWKVVGACQVISQMSKN